MILVGTHPGDFCPHKLLQSSVLGFLPPTPSQQGSWSPLWHWAYFLRDCERLWSWGPWRRSRGLGWGWASGWGPSNTSLPRKVSEMQRGSTPIRGGIGMSCRSNCHAQQARTERPRARLTSWGSPTVLKKGGQVCQALGCSGKGQHHLPMLLSGWRPQGKSCKYVQPSLLPLKGICLKKMRGGVVWGSTYLLLLKGLPW